VNSLIFGAVDYTRTCGEADLRGSEQLYGRYYTAVAAAPPLCRHRLPFVDFKNVEAFEASVLQGRQMGYEGRMLIHPSQIEPSHRLYIPPPMISSGRPASSRSLRKRGSPRVRPPFLQGEDGRYPVYDNAGRSLRP